MWSLAHNNCRHGAFTLIEVLVVVAIIALLIAILVPALAGAKDQALTVSCQSNVRQLLVASLTYSTESKGLLPGNSYDLGADWLGGANNGGSKSGRQPQDGVIWKHMGRQVNAYKCPKDQRPEQFYYSYTANALLSGAAPEWIFNAHYRLEKKTSSLSFSTRDHRSNLVAIPVPLFIEEDPDYSMLREQNSAWDNDDSLVQRHVGKKYGNVGNVDGSVMKHQLPAKPRNYCFTADSLCIRLKSKVVTGLAWDWKDGGKYYGMIRRVPDASSAPWKVRH